MISFMYIIYDNKIMGGNKKIKNPQSCVVGWSNIKIFVLKLIKVRFGEDLTFPELSGARGRT